MCALENVPAGETEDGGFLCLCLRTNVESVKSKSERQALCCVGRKSMHVRKLLWGQVGNKGKGYIRFMMGLRSVHNVSEGVYLYR